jgi:hypothetical protein
MMHTYRLKHAEDGTHIWVAGYAQSLTGDPTNFTVMREFTSEAEALAYVNALNGGPGSAPVVPAIEASDKANAEAIKRAEAARQPPAEPATEDEDDAPHRRAGRHR